VEDQVKLTKKQRAEVVELLRCAVNHVFDTKLPIYRAKCWLDASDQIEDLAIAAKQHVTEDPCYDDHVYLATLLEAAARVEEGSWP
jgi:hypothetical protein